MKPVPVDVLRMIPVCSRLSDADLDQLARSATTKLYTRGQLVFQEGSDADCFIAVVRGRVKVFRALSSGRNMILAILGPGDPVGVVAVFRQMPYPASAAALEDTICLRVPRRELWDLLGEPSFVRGMLAGMSGRMMELTSRLASLSGLPVEERMARLLAKLAAETGVPLDEGTLIPVRLTRQELADLTGTTVETCIRIMSRWKKSGEVETRDKGFWLPPGSDLNAADPEA
jgi:CRP-like cAMP-binding protein